MARVALALTLAWAAIVVWNGVLNRGWVFVAVILAAMVAFVWTMSRGHASGRWGA